MSATRPLAVVLAVIVAGGLAAWRASRPSGPLGDVIVTPLASQPAWVPGHVVDHASWQLQLARIETRGEGRLDFFTFAEGEQVRHDEVRCGEGPMEVAAAIRRVPGQEQIETLLAVWQNERHHKRSQQGVFAPGLPPAAGAPVPATPTAGVQVAGKRFTLFEWTWPEGVDRPPFRIEAELNPGGAP